jgi:hypothetical protein
MRFLRAFFIALFTAFAGCLLAFFVGDYLTRLAHVPEMEGQRGMTVIFLCAPLGILAGLLIGIISSILVRRQGLAGFLIAQGWSLLIVCGLAGLLVGVPYLLSDKPPRIDGKYLTLDFEVRVPASIQLPAQVHEYTVSVSLYTDGTQTRVTYIAPQSIKKDTAGANFSGTVPILSHAANRQLFPSIANVEHGSQSFRSICRLLLEKKTKLGPTGRSQLNMQTKRQLPARKECRRVTGSDRSRIEE